MYSFNSALENGLVTSNPVSKVEYAKGTLHYDAFYFILQTGVRVGGMMGLKWQDIDFRTGVIHIDRSLQYRKVENRFVFGEPKTDAGKRNIPHLYVHATEDEKQKEMEKFAQYVNNMV